MDALLTSSGSNHLLICSNQGQQVYLQTLHIQGMESALRSIWSFQGGNKTRFDDLLRRTSHPTIQTKSLAYPCEARERERERELSRVFFYGFDIKQWHVWEGMRVLKTARAGLGAYGSCYFSRCISFSGFIWYFCVSCSTGTKVSQGHRSACKALLLLAA